MPFTTVAEYLLSRLKEAGVDHIFGIPGDYVLSLMDYIEASPIQLINTCNELNASYAADAYARYKGLGVIAVTYNVGGLSTVNGIAGSMTERVPVMMISGSPGMNIRNQHHFFHHSVGDIDTQLKIYEKITCYASLIDKPDEAPRIINEAITHCLRYQMPVYLEIPSDIASSYCNPHLYQLSFIETTCHEPNLKAAIESTYELYTHAQRPVIISDVEVARYNLKETLKNLLEKTHIPFCTTLLSKGLIYEEHPLFIGNYETFLCQDKLDHHIESSDFMLWLGGKVMDGHVSQIDPKSLICAYNETVIIENKIFYNVPLSRFIKGLEKTLPKHTAPKPTQTRIKSHRKPQPEKSSFCIDQFFDFIEENLSENLTLIAETGDSLFGSALRRLPAGCRYIAQSRYLSLGYATPAVLGASLANPKSRVVAFIGDGGFQFTAQEVSSWMRYKLNPIVFLINNQGYITERMIHGGEYEYNELQAWNYKNFVKTFGKSWSTTVTNMYELAAAWMTAKTNPNLTIFIEIKLNRNDASKGLRYLTKKVKSSPQLEAEADIT